MQRKFKLLFVVKKLEKKKLFIYPCNGNGIDALHCIDDTYEMLGFIDDSAEIVGKEVCGFTVYSRNILDDYPDAKVLAIAGNYMNYLEKTKCIISLGLSKERFVTIAHKSATISSLAILGTNVLIMAGAIIPSNAIIGDHVLILPGSIIHHDVEIGEYTTIGSQVIIAGNVKIGKNCFIASGTIIIDNVTIGDRAFTGFGSNVICKVDADAKVFGNPARKIKL